MNLWKTVLKFTTSKNETTKEQKHQVQMLTLKQNAEVPLLRWPKNIFCMWLELILTWACSTCGFDWAKTDLDHLTFSSRHFYMGTIWEAVPMERHEVKRLTQSTAVIEPDYDLEISQALGSTLLLTWDQTSDLWESSSDRTRLAHRWVTATQRCVKHKHTSTTLIHSASPMQAPWWRCVLVDTRGCLETCFELLLV